MRVQMEYVYILTMSLTCFFLRCYGEEQVRMTMLSLNHFKSEEDSHYECHLSDPDTDTNEVTVKSLRTGMTKDTAADNPDPPEAVYHDNVRQYYRVEMINNGNNDAFGVFGCNATKDGKKETIISTTRMRSDADIVPTNGLFTQTVSIGDENVVISMDTTVTKSNLRWKHDSVFQTKDTINYGVDKFTIDEPIKMDHDGIYECYERRQLSRAMYGLNLLIVRACPATIWGPPDCEGVCDSCYNGGVCDENTGQCVCAPGFMGKNCLKACGGNRYGYTCEKRCTYNGDPEDNCGGTLFCLVHPFGCRCNTGFGGLDCNTGCGENTFGASCLQKCHCTSNTCDPYTGECVGTCESDWTGDFCQECEDGYFGSACDQECHCTSDKCNRESGLCQSGGCLPQWADLFPPYSCQTGLESATSTRVNALVPVPVNCTAVIGPDGNLSDIEFVLSRSPDDLDDTSITANGTFQAENTYTKSFLVGGVDQDLTLHCQLRNDARVAVLIVTVSVYDLPELNTAPTEVNTGNTSVTITWLAWDENKNVGDPPVVGYIPYYKGKGDWTRGGDGSAIESLEFTFNDLDSDTDHSFSVAAVREGEGGEGRRSPPLDVRTLCAVPLDGPQNVAASIAGEKQQLVEISWEHPSNDKIRCRGGVMKFNIYFSSISHTSNGESVMEVTEPSATSFIIADLKVGEEYVFSMTLTTEGGESGRSNPAEHLLPVLPELSASPNLMESTPTSIKISWEAWNETRNNGTPPVVSYNVYHKLSNELEWRDATPYNAIDGRDNYVATVEDLSPDTLYDFSTAAVREGFGGEGPRSPALEQQKTTCDVPLTGPQDVVVNIAGEKQELVEISWEVPSLDEIRCNGGVLKFNIYYSSTSLTPHDEKILEVTNSLVTSYFIDNLEAGETYVFQMTLFTEGGESNRSNQVQHLVPVLPSLKTEKITSTDIDCHTVTIKWNIWTDDEDVGTPPIIEYIPYYKPSDEGDWMQGDAVNHTMDPGKLEYTFSNLDAEETYDFAIAAVREGYGGEGNKTTHRKSTSKCVNVAAIVGSTTASLIFIVLVIVVIILWMRRDSKGRANNKKEEQIGEVNKAYIAGPVDSSSSSKSISGDGNEAVYANIERPVPILLTQLENYIKTTALEQQFLQMFNSQPQSANDVGAKEANKTKNRFKNMLAYDQSRVVLPKKPDDPHSDYYNANYIKNSKGEIGFIASQGPNKASVEDFWRMVWMKSVCNIVMLTNLVENGKDRCFQYWPKSVGETTLFGTITVKWKSTDQYANFEIRDYSILFENKTHRVRNWHYKTWPDKDIPNQPSPLIEFARRVKLDQIHGTTPLLVHCSAGVGRTGTFIALCSLIDVVETSENIDVYGFVEQMREDRISMVQTAKQYKFLHECLLEVYLAGDTAISVDKLTSFDVKSQGKKLDNEYKLLAKLDQMSRNVPSSTTNESDKCRFPDIIPVEKKRPFLQSQGKNSASNYINACCVMSYRKDTAFIATQSPLPSTVEDFWRLVFDWKCPLIVMLNQLDEGDETVCKYWPDKGSSQYGHITVELKEEQKESRYISRIFEVNHAHAQNSISVHHVQLNSWDENNLWDIHTFITDIKKLQQDFMMVEPTVIHCINGVGCTGVVIAVKSEMERIEAEKKVDVFTTVRQLRASNHSLVKTEEEYALCHQLLKLSSPDSTYANI